MAAHRSTADLAIAEVVRQLSTLLRHSNLLKPVVQITTAFPTKVASPKAIYRHLRSCETLNQMRALDGAERALT